MSLELTNYVLWDWSLFLLCKTIPTADKTTPEFPWVWFTAKYPSPLTGFQSVHAAWQITALPTSHGKEGLKPFSPRPKYCVGQHPPGCFTHFTGNPLSVWRRRRNEESEPPRDTGFDIPIKKRPGAFSMFHQNPQPAAAWSLSCSGSWFCLEDLGSYRGETKENLPKNSTAVFDLPPGIKNPNNNPWIWVFWKFGKS